MAGMLNGVFLNEDQAGTLADLIKEHGGNVELATLEPNPLEIVYAHLGGTAYRINAIGEYRATPQEGVPDGE